MAGEVMIELHCTTVGGGGGGGGDRLCFRSAAGRMPAGLGQKQPVALLEPKK